MGEEWPQNGRMCTGVSGGHGVDSARGNDVGISSEAGEKDSRGAEEHFFESGVILRSYVARSEKGGGFFSGDSEKFLIIPGFDIFSGTCLDG